MATVRVPAPLRRFTDDARSIEVSGATVGAVLETLTQRHEALRPHLYDEAGALRPFVNVYLNDQDVRTLRAEATPVAPGDTIVLVPSIAGGAPGRAARSAVEPNRARTSSLSQDELYRYARHIVLPEVGVRGQERLKSSSVLLVGAGGLGSPLAMYLAAAGVGRIGLIDFDTVDETNLQRQVLFGGRDVGRPKVDAARARLEDLNPHITIETHQAALSRDNALDVVRGYDVVADGSDNFPTRYLVNDACALTKTPNVYASIFRFEGQASVFATADGPCYRCLYARPPPPGLVPSCAEGGVFGVLPGIMGTIQANEVLKVVLGIGDTLAGRLLLFDALAMESTVVQVARDPACPACGDDPAITQPIDYEAFCGVGAGPPDGRVLQWSAIEAKRRSETDGDVVFIDVREPRELELCALDEARNIPLQELRRRIDEVPRDGTVVFVCRSGVRSAQATALLLDQGWTNVVNLEGGLLAWQERVDRSLMRY